MNTRVRARITNRRLFPVACRNGRRDPVTRNSFFTSRSNSKCVLNRNLNPQPRRNRAGGLSKARRFQLPDRNPKVCAVNKIKKVGTESQFLICRPPKTLEHRQIEIEETSGPKGVPPNAPILTKRRQ